MSGVALTKSSSNELQFRSLVTRCVGGESQRGRRTPNLTHLPFILWACFRPCRKSRKAVPRPFAPASRRALTPHGRWQLTSGHSSLTTSHRGHRGQLQGRRWQWAQGYRDSAIAGPDQHTRPNLDCERTRGSFRPPGPQPHTRVPPFRIHNARAFSNPANPVVVLTAQTMAVRLSGIADAPTPTMSPGTTRPAFGGQISV